MVESFVSTTMPIRSVRHETSPFDLLPDEILIHILLHVPFDSKTMRNLSQVSRRFRAIINPEVPHIFMNRVASEQYFSVNIVFGTADLCAYDAVLLKELRDTHDRAIFVMRRVKASMTQQDLDSECLGWEHDFYNSLVLLQKANRWYRLNNVTHSDEPMYYFRHLPLDVHLWIRYACSKIARCLQSYIVKVSSSLPLVADFCDRKFRQVATHRREGFLATALYRLVPFGRGLETIQDVLASIPPSGEESKQLCPIGCNVSLTMYLDFIYLCTRFVQNLDHMRLAFDNVKPVKWLLDADNITCRKANAHSHAIKTQEYLYKLIRESSESSELDLLSFFNYLEIKREQNLEHRLFECEDVRNMSAQGIATRSEVPEEQQPREASNITAQYLDSIDALKQITLDLDWECILDDELVHRDSKLRQSLSPTTNLLRQLTLIIDRFEAVKHLRASSNHRS